MENYKLFKNRLILLTIVIVSLCCTVTVNAAKDRRLKVVTSTEFLSDWVREIGKELVKVDTIHDPRTDIHFFEPRPGHIKMCSKADVFVTPGLDLDVWIQPLLDASRNPNIQYGTDGYIDASVGVHVLQKTAGRVDMSMGDVHPFGNPHYFYDMSNVNVALKNIERGLCSALPNHADEFETNRVVYWESLVSLFAAMRRQVEPYKGVKVVAYHRSWEYFAKEFGLEIVGYFEKKPGIPPSAKAIKFLGSVMEEDEVKIILKEPYFPNRAVKKIAKKSGASVLELTNFPGGRPGAESYIANLKANIDDLLLVLKDVYGDSYSGK